METPVLANRYSEMTTAESQPDLRKKASAPPDLTHHLHHKEQEKVNGAKIVGDAAKSIVAVLTLLFLFLLMGHEFGVLDIFSTSYLTNGFCISNVGKSVTIQSHAISFYADSFMALIMGLIVRQG